MYYQYIGCTTDRKMIEGNLAAESEEVAERILTSQGYRIFSLKPVTAFVPSRVRMFPASSKVKPEVLIVFSRQLALLLESGNDIVTSLELLKVQLSNRYFKSVIDEILAHIRGGSNLSAALGNHPKVFSRVYIQSVGVGEHVGNLTKVLRQVADYMEKDVKATKGIKGALRYPIMVSAVAFIVIGILIAFVLPAFSELYSSLGAELPPLTKMTLSAFEWLTNYGLYIMGVILLVAGLLYAYTKTLDGRLLRDRLVLKLPLLGRVSHLNELIRCCRSMSILYRAGLPVAQIISLVIEDSNNLVAEDALTRVQQDVFRGEGLSQSMAKSKYFLPMMVQMVSVGESTGNLDAALLAAAEAYETEAEDKMRSLIGSIQPVITVVIGIVVAVIALSLVTAMYSMYGQAI